MELFACGKFDWINVVDVPRDVTYNEREIMQTEKTKKKYTQKPGNCFVFVQNRFYFLFRRFFDVE